MHQKTFGSDTCTQALNRCKSVCMFLYLVIAFKQCRIWGDVAEEGPMYTQKDVALPCVCVCECRAARNVKRARQA